MRSLDRARDGRLRCPDHGQDVADVVVEEQLIAAPHGYGEHEYESRETERLHGANLRGAELRSIR
jgi:hypothetical protein